MSGDDGVPFLLRHVEEHALAQDAGHANGAVDPPVCAHGGGDDERTGQIQVYLAGDPQGYAFPSPGLSLRTPEWFHARDVAAVANDTLTFEIFPPEVEDLWLPVHALDLVEVSMPQGQNWNLEALSQACAEAGRYEFLLDATPEPFVGAAGSPVAPVAVP
jgi:kynurenine formamidase